jgi:hypothetical protein
MRRVINEAAVAAVVSLLLTAAGQAADQNCLPWASAAPVIAKNSLLPANIIYQMVQSRTGGQIIHALDETKPGSGLGLSIVADLAHLYKGRFDLEPSPQGGLRARLNLPAA